MYSIMINYTLFVLCCIAYTQATPSSSTTMSLLNTTSNHPSISVNSMSTALASDETIQNINPHPPPGLQAHAFYHAGGTVNISDGPNPFANNVLDGRNFLTHEMNFTEEDIDRERGLACEFWFRRFGLNCTDIEMRGQGAVSEYKIAPAVEERFLLLTSDCPTPPGGHLILDGGFQLFIESEEGAIGMVDGQPIDYPKDTNVIYSWLRVELKEPTDTCEPTFPDWLVFPYRSASVAKWTITTIVFELEIMSHPDNPYGHGEMIGVSSPIVNFNDYTITNRLFNYINFDLTS